MLTNSSKGCARDDTVTLPTGARGGTVASGEAHHTGDRLQGMYSGAKPFALIPISGQRVLDGHNKHEERRIQSGCHESRLGGSECTEQYIV
jgi:hypothetical protein